MTIATINNAISGRSEWIGTDLITYRRVVKVLDATTSAVTLDVAFFYGTEWEKKISIPSSRYEEERQQQQKKERSKKKKIKETRTKNREKPPDCLRGSPFLWFYDAIDGFIRPRAISSLFFSVEEEEERKEEEENRVK